MAILPLELPVVAGVGLLGIGAIILGIFIIGWLKKALVNSVFGLIALFVINYLAELLKMDALKISINLVSVLVTAVLGLAGVGLLIILKLLGIAVQ
jgi:pro-sigmaK processing inhibitor BofA